MGIVILLSVRRMLPVGELTEVPDEELSGSMRWVNACEWVRWMWMLMAGLVDVVEGKMHWLGRDLNSVDY